jgi:hypothetical protein
MDDTLVIDCDSCPMRHSTACDECVVGVVLNWSPRRGRSASRWAAPTVMRWPDHREPFGS